MKINFQQFELKKIQAPHFLMRPVELKDYIDFEVKRVYFITKPIGNTGAHCHKIEEEFFIMIQGSCVAVIDKGNGLEEFKFEAPISAFYVSEYVWHHFKDLSSDVILLALSSTNYNSNRSDYIEDYEEFKKVISEKINN
ncbi:dTDP-6-deoxy-3,4-keto-hexulose isomerase [Candidatus Kuenenbacteria bacterium HGW-Kuenenbacteria-1]|uniref:dTDP-6-deoxy-3,4-keto-hexulose isomerase n=1 Tax=Candidatus Kuenenbacteria bacterium HGW-Kuenenbacteria-1 TaxID=2013812 RepID=A0A2N1UN45_9BACT|nr:MAG: dTDP-6-deoxy-3,4-keto-hexulose isomerase [Candidatus Kuenenbacteria bacterium HGW-Kuenenbacteria-1]